MIDHFLTQSLMGETVTQKSWLADCVSYSYQQKRKKRKWKVFDDLIVSILPYQNLPV